MSLDELTRLIRKSYLYIIIILILFSGGFLVYYFIDNPSGERSFGKIPTPEFINSVAKTIDLSAEPKISLSIPSLVKVYKSSGLAPEADVAAKLGFLDEPKRVGNSLMWGTKLVNFKVGEEKKDFTYSASRNIGAKTVTKEQAERIAKEFLQKINLYDSTVTLTSLDVTYIIIKDPEFEIVDQTKEYNVFSFNFGAKVDSISIVNEQGSKPLFNVWVSADGNIYRVTGNLQTLKFSDFSTYPTEKLNSIKKDISGNKFTVVNLTTDINVPRYSSNNKVSVVFEKAELVYYLPAKEIDLLQPVILLEGRQKGSASNLLFALKPALKEEAFR